MRNRRTKKMLQEYPQLLDNSVVLSPVEVEKIIASADYILSFEELIERAKTRFPQFGLEYWKEIDIAIHTKKHSKNKELTHNRNTYRIALASIAIVIILFFTCIPVGRTMAKTAYSYIINVFENSLTIVPENPGEKESDLIPQNEGTPRTTYSSINQFTEETGYIPLALREDWIVLDEIWGEYIPEFGQIVVITYSDSFGKKLTVSQTWFNSIQAYVETDGNEFKAIKLSNDCILYSSISPITGGWDGTMVLDNSIISFGAEKGIDYNKLIAALKEIIR